MLPSPESKKVVFETIGYQPYPEQWDAHCEEIARLIVVAGGERAGKSRWAAAEATAALMMPNNALAFCGEDYDQAKKEMKYVIEDLTSLDALAYESTPKQGRWIVKSATGSWAETISLQDGAGELTARGEAYHLVLVLEAGRVSDPGILRAARGRVSETRGRALFIGTLWNDFGWYSELYETLEGDNVWNGVRYILPSWANKAIFPGGENDPEIENWRRTLTPSEFARFVAAKKVKPPAIIYGEFDQQIHVSFECQFDPAAPVDLSIDPGYFPSKYAVLAIQPAINSYGQECINVIDEIWVDNKVHQEVISEAKGRFWWPNVHQIVGGHETSQHAATASTAEVWRRETGSQIAFRTLRRFGNRERIMRVKTFLKDPLTGEPRLLIHPRCLGLAKEFREWRRKTSKQTGKVISERPIDKMSDALDALGNYALAEFGPTNRPSSGGRAGSVRVFAKG